MEFDARPIEESTQGILRIPSMKVLVVDGDSTCLAVVSNILQNFGYEVVTAKLGSSALSIVEQMKDELHLVLMELHLPDMGRYEMLKKMREACNLPFVIMTCDASNISIVAAFAEGAEHYFMKPVMVEDLRDLWKFAARREKNDEAMSNQQNMAHRGIIRVLKRKEPEPLAKDEAEIELKRQKFTWTYDLHNKFMESIRLLGASASPEKIVEHMNVPGLEKDAVLSYMQLLPNFGSQEIWGVGELNWEAHVGNYYRDELLLKPVVDDITDGLIDFPKGADQFSDDQDFNIWLSTL